MMSGSGSVHVDLAQPGGGDQRVGRGPQRGPHPGVARGQPVVVDDRDRAGRASVELVASPPRTARRARAASSGSRSSVPAAHVEEAGRVAHRPGQRAVVDHVGVAEEAGPAWDATERALHADDARPAGRQPDRAAHVRAGGEGHEAGGQRGAGPAARPARRAVEVPRVAGGAVEHRAGVGEVADLGRRGEADGHRAGGQEPASVIVLVVVPMRSRRVVLARVSGQPSTDSSSLMPSGTPASGPGSSPAATRASTSSATARARSGSRNTNALSAGLSRSMRSRRASSTSRARSVPARTSSAIVRADQLVHRPVVRLTWRRLAVVHIRVPGGPVTTTMDPMRRRRGSSSSSSSCCGSTRRPPTPAEELWAAQFDLGLAWVHFPVGPRRARARPPPAGGRRRAPPRRPGRPSNLFVNMMGVGMAGPTLVAYGTRGAPRPPPPPGLHAARRSGARCSASRAPARTSPRSARGRCATATSGSSTARRCWTTQAHVAKWGLLLTRTDPEAPEAQGPHLLLHRHARRRASRCVRCASSPATPSSTRCTSPTCASRTRSGSARSATAGGSRSPP